jgi:hypothetical protein
LLADHATIKPKIDLRDHTCGQNMSIESWRRQSRRTAGQSRDTAAEETTCTKLDMMR